jgi:aspartate/methionine/tyrosine aminotransferase
MGMTLDDPPEGAFYVFPSLEGLPAPLRNGMSLFEAALEQQVICVPGAFFDIDPGGRRSHLHSRLASTVRLSFGPDLGTLTQGLDRLEALVKAHS